MWFILFPVGTNLGALFFPHSPFFCCDHASYLATTFSPKHHRSSGKTTWIPLVTEIMLFPTGLNGQCGGNRITEFNAATEDSITFMCSGSNRNVVDMSCHHAFDGETDPEQDPNRGGYIGAWRPQCGADNGGCAPKEVRDSFFSCSSPPPSTPPLVTPNIDKSTL
jgi:hypothetical protein